jgi:hypothetical protein
LSLTGRVVNGCCYRFRRARSSAASDRCRQGIALDVDRARSRLAGKSQLAAGIADLDGPAESSHAARAARDATLRRRHAAGAAEAVLTARYYDWAALRVEAR